MISTSYPFGQSGLEFPRIGLGLAALGRPGYINLGHANDLGENYEVHEMERRTHLMLDLAYEKGIRYFDAAQSYGKAESFLMSWLEKRAFNSETIAVGSKWGYTYTANWKVEAEKHEVKDHSLEVLDRQWTFTQQLLPYLKLYQIHSATFESGVLENVEVHKRLAEIKQDGVRIGLSLSGPQQAAVLEAAMTVNVDGVPLFDAVQITYNILEQYPGKVLSVAADKGMGIIVKEAVANGRLTSRNNMPEFEDKKIILQQLANKYHVQIDAIAIGFILAQPWAHLVLSGAAQEDHLLSNLQAASIQFESEDLEQLHELNIASEQYWQERSQLKWN